MDDRLRTPMTISMFPKELVRISGRRAKAGLSKLVHFDELGRGGHFAALEQPALFAAEVRTGFRTLRP